MKHWSKVAPLNFQYTSGEADIDILFVRGDHGDGVKNQFDGPGVCLCFINSDLSSQVCDTSNFNSMS